MRYLLDTNTCIAVMRSDPKAVQHMTATSPGDSAIPAITHYERYTGVAKCSNPIKAQAKVDLLLRTVHQLAFETTSARRSAQLRAVLEAQGMPIRPYDVLLAGQALALSRILVTSNTKEFSCVPGLPLENWQV
jgi:tRNA(fMet)-specific endonuclease VapC